MLSSGCDRLSQSGVCSSHGCIHKIKLVKNPGTDSVDYLQAPSLTAQLLAVGNY